MCSAMSVSVKTPLKCPSGGTPTHYTIYENQKVCSCHGGYNYLDCDGTENKSYCLLGCSACYTMIKKKNEREDQVLKDLQEKLKKAEVELASARKEIAEMKGELQVFKNTEEARITSGLTNTGSFSQYEILFQS